MRLFTALDLPDNLRARLAALRDENALEARWSPPEQYHITLRFIGEVDPDQAARYEDVLSQIEVPRVRCVPYGLDALPSRRNPRVVVVGFERTESLLHLYKTLTQALKQVGLAPEDRSYRPHVTLARIDEGTAPETVHQFLDANAPDSLPSFQADRFHLYESTRTQDGAVHERRRSVQLATE